MKRLTAKEEEVMELIWETGPCAPKDVLALYDDPKPHINTIATMFQSLERKGFLTHRTAGRGYIYEPKVRKEDYGHGKLGQFISKYFANSYMSIVSTLVSEEKVSREELLEFVNQLKSEK